MIFAAIDAEKANFPITKLCRALRVSLSGFHAWRRRPESKRSQEDRRLKVLIRTSFKEGRGYYGSPRVHDDLTEWKERVSRKRIIRLMQEDGLKARVRKRYKVTTDSCGRRSETRPVRRSESRPLEGYSFYARSLSGPVLSAAGRRDRAFFSPSAPPGC